MQFQEQARQLLHGWKGHTYLSGAGVLHHIGISAASAGKRAVLIRDTFPGSDRFVEIIRRSVLNNGVDVIAEITGARPNAPVEDLLRITAETVDASPDLIISFGGGSTIDAAKAAEVLRSLGGTIDQYFGTGLVTAALMSTGKSLCPHMAIQTVAGSAAHLTKYSNITDLQTGQKKLIVDDAIVPAWPVFDYSVTYGAPHDLTIDGALDGVAHSLEVLYGAVKQPTYAMAKALAVANIALVLEYLPRLIKQPRDAEARDALCLSTDLGGYSIMIGGTNGAHLNSFSFVDILSHGRACALMNPYYTVFFAPAVEEPLQTVGALYRKAGLTQTALENLRGRALGIAVAEAMINLEKSIGFPVCLNDVPGFGRHHIERALTAAKNPQLSMKLQNMPVPLTAEMVDDYMGPVLEAATTGDFSVIVNVN